MGKSTGLISFSGSVGNVTIDKKGNVRQKPQSNKSKFDSAASMVRTRENASEFGLAASAGKMLRESLRVQLSSASDSLLTGRITKAMRAIIGLDTTQPRGSRRPLAANGGVLSGLNFNIGASLGQSLQAPFSIAAQGAGVTLSIPGLDPRIDVNAPQGATHYRILYAAVALDFAAMTYRIATVASPLGIQSLSAPAQVNITQVASFATATTADELVIAVVGMDYYQRLNGLDYPLNNNVTNPLAVVYTSAVAGPAGPGVVFDTTLAGPSGTDAGITFTASAGDGFGFNALATGSSTPANMVINVGGAQVASVDYLGRYAGLPFSFTRGGVTRTGVFGSVANL